MAEIEIVRSLGTGLRSLPSQAVAIGANEPSGFSRIAEYDMSAMESNVEDAVLAGEWSTLSNGSLAGERQIIQNAGVPIESSPYALRITVEDGKGGGGANMWYAQGWGLDDVDECYLACYLRVNSPIERAASGTHRIVRLYMTSSSNKHNGNSNYLSNNAVTPGDNVSEFRLLQSVAAVTSGGELTTGHHHDPNENEAGTFPIKVDQWHLIERWYKSNSLDGNSTVGDGAYKIWVDGNLHHHRTGIGAEGYDDPASSLDPGGYVVFKGWADTRGFWSWWGDLVWTHTGSSTKIGDSFIDWGHIYISAPGD